MNVGEFLKQRWFTVDARTLAFFRVCFGLLLFTNLIDRVWGINLVSFYSNDGVWPNHYALFLPPTHGFWSLLLAFSTPTEVTVACCCIAVVYLLYIVGYRTQLMQVLALICVESLNFRYLLVQHGGDVVVNIIAVWSLFLPLGARWSVDALLASLRRHDEGDVGQLNARGWESDRVLSVVSAAFFLMCLNFAVIYFFNALHKNGPSWRNGSAVHDLVWVNRLATPLAVWLRTHGLQFVSPVLTYGTLVVEWSLVFLIVSPWQQRWFRNLAFINIVGLHGGIALLSVLGPFSWAMMAFGSSLVTPEVWRWLEGRWALPKHHRTVPVDFMAPAQRFGARLAARLDAGRVLTFVDAPGHQVSAVWVAEVMRGLPGLRWMTLLPYLPWVLPMMRALARAGARALTPCTPSQPVEGWERFTRGFKLVIPLLIALAVGSQVLMENWGVPAALKPRSRPDWMTATIDYLQIMQGWSMFAPETPHGDDRLIIDATLADGSHLDLLTGQAPDFDAHLHGPWGMDQHWCETHGRMPNMRQHWRNFRDYLRRLPRIHGWPEDKAVRALEVWRLRYDIPPLGGTEPLNVRRERLFGDEPL